MTASPLHNGSSPENLAQAIFEHASRISRTVGVSELIRLNADFARRLTGADRCSLWLVDERAGELWTRLADGIDALRIPRNQGLVGACVQTGQAILANDPQANPLFLGAIDQRSGYVTHQVLCIPMQADGRTLGALQLLNKPGGFTSTDTDLVGLLAHFAATAIHGEQLRLEVESARLLRHELDLARDVQARLLPQGIPSIPQMQLAAFCRPAHSVGGDYYDLVQLDATHLAFTLGDVSGKGIAAAVMMASIQVLLRSLLQQSPNNLAGIIGEVGRALYQSSTANRFSTLFCGIVDLTTGRLTYINAGHANPLLLRGLTQLEALSGGGLPLGLLPDCRYEERSLQLLPGDTLLVVSDGIQEVCNAADEFWDEARIDRIFLDHANAPLDALPAALIAEADAWAAGAEQHDDMTIVALRFLAPATTPHLMEDVAATSLQQFIEAGAPVPH